MHIEKLDYNLHSILMICIEPIKSSVKLKSCDNAQHPIEI
jgi:hypothetical protein